MIKTTAQKIYLGLIFIFFIRPHYYLDRTLLQCQ